MNLTNVSSNQTAFVWKVTAGFGTSFMLCRSHSIIWEMVNDLDCEWVVAVCAADENQSNVAFCVRDPKAPLINSFEKLRVSPSHKFNQSEIITSCFFFGFASRPLCFFMTSCSNFRKLQDLICVFGPLWCGKPSHSNRCSVLCSFSNTRYSMSIVFLSVLKLATVNCSASPSVIDNTSISTLMP